MQPPQPIAATSYSATSIEVCKAQQTDLTQFEKASPRAIGARCPCVERVFDHPQA